LQVATCVFPLRSIAKGACKGKYSGGKFKYPAGKLIFSGGIFFFTDGIFRFPMVRRGGRKVQRKDWQVGKIKMGRANCSMD
jgi:hypothetical protein